MVVKAKRNLDPRKDYLNMPIPESPEKGGKPYTKYNYNERRAVIIRLLLVSMKAYFLLPDISIPINDLTFAIRYKKNIATFPFFEGFSYNTTIIENATETTFTNKHILLVSGFDGTFEFSRADIMNFIPAKFKFEGTCEDAIVAS